MTEYKNKLRIDILDKCKQFLTNAKKLPTFGDVKSLGFSEKNIRTAYGNLTTLHDELKDTTDVEIEVQNDSKTEIINAYIEILTEKKNYPSNADFAIRGVSDKRIKTAFGNITNLHDYMRDHEAEKLGAVVLTGHQVIANRSIDDVNEEIGKYKRFVITSVVNGCDIHEGFYNAIKSYCKINDAALLVIPCADMILGSGNNERWTFSPNLKDELFIRSYVSLNANLTISPMKMRATHSKPVEGMRRFSHELKSVIYASPKQFLEYVPDKYSDMPNAVMTTGALTVPQYRRSSPFVHDRTACIAEFDHLIGALIVEIENNHIFHFRQVQADVDGSFIDLGINYQPNGETNQEDMALVLGDWHTGSTDPRMHGIVQQITSEVIVDTIVVHDLLDGMSINHHIKDKVSTKAARSLEGRSSLEDEIKECAEELKKLADQKSGPVDIIVVKSNHDEWLARYLDEARFVNDSENYYISLDLAKAMLDGNDPLEYGVRNYGGVTNDHRVTFLQRCETYVYGGVELGNHGDKGTNGSKASLAGIEIALGNCVIGHAHSAAIHRSVYRVGTSTLIRLKYNDTPSTWTHTHALVAKRNGAKQLINVMGNDKWRL